MCIKGTELKHLVFLFYFMVSTFVLKDQKMDGLIFSKILEILKRNLEKDGNLGKVEIITVPRNVVKIISKSYKISNCNIIFIGYFKIII